MMQLKTGLIGDHIGRSRFSAGLALMCTDHGLSLEFTAIDGAETGGLDFNATVATCQQEGWTGVSVTHPYKAAAAGLRGFATSDDTRSLGACNTLVFGPEPVARNTDYSGFLAAWGHRFGARRPGPVAVAGAGGVARAIVPALARLGADDIAIWDSDPARAGDLAGRTGGPARAILPEQAPDAIRGAEGLVNATPLGMAHAPGSAFDPALIGPQSWAFDAVYTPSDTEFLRAAAGRGLAVLSGFDLFCFMAMRSFEAYTGLRPDPATTLPRLETLRPTEDA